VAIFKFNAFPLENVEAQDKIIVEKVSKAMLMSKYPEVECKEWTIKKNPNDYKIICKFPANTIFTITDLSLIDICDPFFIENIWIEPDVDNVKLVTQVRIYDKPFVYTKQTLKVLRHKLKSKHANKIETEDVNVFDNDGDFVVNNNNNNNNNNNKKRKL